MRYVLILIILSFFSVVRAELQLVFASVDDYLETGVLEYQNNNFEKALENFLLAERAGLKNPDLYYNIGNAYFRLSNLPNAIIYYKRALLLNSSHKSAQRNLDFVLSITRDRQEAEEDNFVTNLIIKSLYFFSINTLLVIVLTILIIIIALIHVQWRYTNFDRTFLRFINFVFLFIWLGLSGLTASRISLAKNNNEAVITDNIVYVYSGPSESFTRLFSIHEGTVLKIQNEEAGWTQITTLNGFSGWVWSDTYRRIVER